MAFAPYRRDRAPDASLAAPLRMMALLLGTAALLRGEPAHAQAKLEQLPDASQAIEVKPPSSDQLFRLESESSLRQRLVNEARRANAPIPVFPPEPPPGTPYAGRVFPDSVTFAEPGNVCYGRLYFEQTNFERYGWDLTVVQPLVSLGIFYFDVATLPLKLATAPCRCYECSAGYCLPGDAVPLLVYPPEFTTGKAADRAARAVSNP